MTAPVLADAPPTGNRERPTLNPEAVDYRGGEYDPAPPAELLALMRRDFERERRAGRTPLNAENVRRTLVTIRQQQRLAALRTRQPPAPATRARTAGRTPRRPRQAPTRAVSRDGGDSGDDGPAPPGPLVHQGSSGLPRRVYLALVRDRAIPHARVGRLVVVRLDVFLAALGLADAPAATAPEPAWTPETLVRLIRGGRS